MNAQQNVSGPVTDEGRPSEKIKTKITLILAAWDGSGIYLMPFNRHSYMLPSAYLAEGETPAEVVQKIAPKGYVGTEYLEVGSWIDGSTETPTSHLILSVVVSAPGGSLFVSKDRPHMLGMLADNELSEFLAVKLGWVKQSASVAKAQAEAVLQVA